MKTTPWFDADTQKPIRCGVYEIQFEKSYSIWYAKWNGKFWCSCSPWITSAAVDKDRSSWVYEGDAKWRGLTASSWLQESGK